MIKLKDISFSYANRLVLDDLNFEIKSGEFVVILGANGAGKSSIIKLLSGLNLPNKGEIKINNKLISEFNASSLARIRAVLEQECTLAFEASVLEVVLLGRFAYSKFSTSYKDVQIARECLSMLGLKEFENRLYFQLSGGEKRRVQFARVLAQLSDKSGFKDKVLLLDEPNAGLDPSCAHKTLSVAKSISKAGASVVAVLHDPNMAALYADKILLLKDKKILDYDIPKNIMKVQKLEQTYAAKCKIISDADSDFVLFLNQ